MSLKPWFQKANDEIARREAVRNMTRQQAFNAGYLSVKDLDDEELRAGKCRGPDGNIPKVVGKTEVMDDDQYQMMVAEHEKRWNQNLRERLDVMTEVIASVALDDTVEPRDRVEAAKYIIERVAGKPTERVQVNVSKAPWEEMLAGIASGISREESRKQRGLTIDQDGNALAGPEDGTLGSAEDVGDILPDTGVELAESQSGPPTPNIQGQGRVDDDRWYEATHSVVQPAEPRTDWADVGASGGQQGRRQDLGPSRGDDERDTPVVDVASLPADYVPADSAYLPAPPAPSHDNVANSSSTMVTDLLTAQQDLADRRKLAKDRIQAAKRSRAAARKAGADLLKGKEFSADTTEIDENGEGQVTFNLD
jgi:hypothetical protein